MVGDGVEALDPAGWYWYGSRGMASGLQWPSADVRESVAEGHSRDADYGVSGDVRGLPCLSMETSSCIVYNVM